MTNFEINAKLDVPRFRDEFARNGRVRIVDFLADNGAERIRNHLVERDDWRLVLNAGDKVFEVDHAGYEALTLAQRDELDRRVIRSAAYAFQYRYESIRVSDSRQERRTSGSLLDEFAAFLSGPEVIGALQQVTGARDIDFADAQATRYGPGHFLTGHDDAVEGKHRRAAYVFGLTPDWRAEWGGLLLFHDGSGDIARGFTPFFNTLNIFSVPQLHSVSYVTPSAPFARVSITGWFRQAGEKG